MIYYTNHVKMEDFPSLKCKLLEKCNHQLKKSPNTCTCLCPTINWPLFMVANIPAVVDVGI